jgi:hypothetical protein
MSNAIDWVENKKLKAIDYISAEILKYSQDNNVNLFDTIQEGVRRGMEYQDNLDHINKWSGYHTSDMELQIDENGYPYYGITKNIPEN